MADLSGFYTATHGEADERGIPTIESIREMAAESWGQPEAAYEFRDVIAVGGMGAVLRVWDSRVEREVAMKMLLRPGCSEKVARFFAEARLTAALEHPGIVSVHDVGVSPFEEPYFTMTLVPGGGLHHQIGEWAKPGKAVASLHERIRIVRQVCDAIAYAHERGVCHLDVKPHNVMVGSFGEVVVVDWGVARALSERDAMDTPEDSGNAIRGTPGFMAPEQAEGRLDALGASTDVFALGALAYSLAVLKPPIVGGSVAELMAHTKTGAVVAPDRRGDVPHVLSRIIMRAMAADADRRYLTARAFADDLDAWLSGRQPAGIDLPAMDRFALFWARNRVAGRIAVGAAVTLVLGGVGVIGRLQIERDRASLGQAAAVAAQHMAVEQLADTELARADAERARRSAERSAYLAELRLAQQDLAHGRIEAAVAALSRCVEAARGWEWAWLMRIAKQVRPGDLELGPVKSARAVGDAVILLQRDHVAVWAAGGSDMRRMPTPVPWRQLSASHDKTQVLLFDPTGRYNLFSVAEGRSVWSTRAGPVGALDAVPLGDGQHLVVAVSSKLLIWDMPAQKVVGQINGGSAMVRSLRAVGDGRRVLSAGDDGVVRLWDVPTRRLQRPYETGLGPLSFMRLDVASRRMVVAAMSGSVAVIDLQGGRVRGIRPDFGVSVDMAFSPDGNRLAVLSPEGACEVWDLGSLRQLGRRQVLVSDPAVAIAWRERSLYAIGRSGAWRVWSYGDAESVRFDLPRSPASKPILVAGDGGRVLLGRGRALYGVDLASIGSDAPLKQARLPSNVLDAVDMGTYVLAACVNGGVYRVSRVPSSVRQVVGPSVGSEAYVRAQLAPDGQHAVFWAKDGTAVRIAISGANSQPQAVPAFSGAEFVRFANNGRVVVVGPDGMAGYDDPMNAAPAWRIPNRGALDMRILADSAIVLFPDSVMKINLSDGQSEAVHSFSRIDGQAIFLDDTRFVSRRESGIIEVSDLMGTPMCILSRSNDLVGDILVENGVVMSVDPQGRVRAWY